MKVINKQGKVVNVTKTAYEIIYKHKGFKKYEKNDITEQPTLEEKQDDNTITLEDEETSTLADKLALKTNDELKAILDEYNVEYRSRANKSELISTIIENMEG